MEDTSPSEARSHTPQVRVPIETSASPLDLVESNPTGEVRIPRSRMAREIGRVLAISKRIGLRLERYLAAAPEMVHLHQLIRDDETGYKTPVPVNDAEGKPVMVPWLPDREWRENYGAYFKTISTFASEARELAKMTPKGPQLTDAENAAELRQLAEDAIRTMRREDLERLLKERAAVDVVGVEVKEEP